MKTKKILWPWAERQIKGKKKTSGQPVFGSANMVQDNTGNEVFDNTEIPYTPVPLRSVNGSTSFMCMNIPIYGWFYLKNWPASQEHNKCRILQELIFTIKWSFLPCHW